MSSPEQSYDEFCSLVGSPPAEPYEEFLEEQDANSSSSPSSSESNTVHKLVSELCVSDSDMREVKQEKEALLKLASPPEHTGMPLLGCPFVLKLYLAAGSAAMTMINWSPNGRQLVVEYAALQDHLAAGSQIFRSRSVRQFAEKLRGEGFLRVQPEEMEPLGRAAANVKTMRLYFQQPQFVRGELGSLRKLMEESLLIEKYYPRGAQYAEAAEDDEEEPEFPVPLHMPSKSHLERMRQRGDKCCTIISVRSPFQEAHCRLRTLLSHMATSKVLHASSDQWKDTSMKDFPTFSSSAIKFVRPYDSVLVLDADKPLPEYAGYYGQVSPTKVNKFFGDSLPRYGNKTTGYKDIAMETTQKPSNFQQNLPIGLASSEGEDDDPDDVPPPVSPAGQDSDMDSMPSTSAAAAKGSSGRQIGADSVDDQDLEEAMQELCGGSTTLKENVSSGSRGRAKGQPQPKATSRKRRAKSYDSSSSENETELSRKPKRAKKNTVKESTKEEAIEDYQQILSKRRGPKSKDKTPKTTSRKRFASPNTDEASPPRKRARKDSRKTQQLEELGKEEFLGQTKKHLRETDEENKYKETEENEHVFQEENAEEIEYALQDEVENDEEDDYVEDMPEGYEQLEEYEQPEEDEQLEEHEQPEYQVLEEDEYSQVEHRGEEYLQEEKPEEQPEGEYPEGAYPEGEFPEGEYPQEEYPEGGYPEGAYPEGAYPQGEYPEGGYPEGEYPEGEFPQGEYPEGEYPQGGYPEGGYPEYSEGQYPGEDCQPEEEQPEEQPEEVQPEEEQPEEGQPEEEQPLAVYPEEDEQPEEDLNEDEIQEAEVDENTDEDLVAEEEDEEEESDDEDEEGSEDFEDEDYEDDDDDDDYSVQYRADPQDQEKPRRYELRNSMRKSN